jgi:hypothetical protein
MGERVTLVIPDSQLCNNCNEDFPFINTIVSCGSRSKTFVAKRIRDGSHVCGRHYV